MSVGKITVFEVIVIEVRADDLPGTESILATVQLSDQAKEYKSKEIKVQTNPQTQLCK